MKENFLAFSIQELENLLSAMKAGRVPQNIALHEKVMRELRKQYDRENHVATSFLSRLFVQAPLSNSS